MFFLLLQHVLWLRQPDRNLVGKPWCEVWLVVLLRSCFANLGVPVLFDVKWVLYGWCVGGSQW
jgi:hypothetical protein